MDRALKTRLGSGFGCGWTDVRRLFWILIAAALLWAGGLLAFVSTLPKERAGAVPKADGVVVYTGGGARIAAGMELMERGAAKRLLISGVNEDTSRAALVEMMPSAAPYFECCVDLGHEARTTEGNAAEVRDWARANGFGKLILVTSDYHMPRALVETRARLPQTEIVAFPVASGFIGRDGRPTSPEAWKQLAFEYSKYIAARAKTAVNAQ